MDRDEITALIKEAHQEAHLCNSLKEVHDWIDWFEKRLREINRSHYIPDIDQDLKIIRKSIETKK